MGKVKAGVQITALNAEVERLRDRLKGLETDVRQKRADNAAELERLEAEAERLREALEEIAMWAEYGYQDLNSGGVLSCVKMRAKEVLSDTDNLKLNL